MIRHAVTVVAATHLMLLMSAVPLGAAPDLPRVGGKPAVASVQGEPITLEEFNRELEALRQERGPGATVDRAVELTLLDRMIRAALIVQEARRMELDKLPEVRKLVDSFARTQLRQELFDRAVKDVKADPKDVEAEYRTLVREWKIAGALFEREEQAQGLAAEVGAGKDFTGTARAYLAEGKAKKVEDGVFVSRQALGPDVARAVAGMTAGSTSSVISTPSGFLVLRVEDIRYPDNPEARAQATEAVLRRKRQAVFSDLDQALKKKYAKVHRDLLASLDYESDKPGIDALLKDRRALVDIRGEKPITVGELTEELKFRFFHGSQLAAARKRLNARKEETLDSMTHRRVFRKEALRLGLDKTEAYQAKVKEQEASALFSAFLRKVIAPDIKLTEDELKAYYDEHRAAYAMPEMLRLRSLVFADQPSAEVALQSLKKGAEFQWVAGRAEGQVDPSAPGVMSFDGRPILASELPESLRKAVAGASTGDLRLYAGPDGRFYVLAVEQTIAAQPRPYEQVKQEIAEKVIQDKAEKAIEQYAEKLRALSDVKVYLKAS